MKHSINILLITLLLGMFSCSDWLDVKPIGEVDADNMFEEEIGFLQTLTGSYVLLSDFVAYGNELTAGYVEEIVRNWTRRSEFFKFDYKHEDVVRRLDTTWNKMYEAIANTNLLLDHLEKKNKEDFKYYDLIKGEALGLRAYIHLDLLRLYGPVLTSGMDEKAIPYHETFSNQTVKLMTAREVLSKIQRDLEAAYLLLKDDPIKVYGRKDEYAPDIDELCFQFRGIRMNYYAVCGTLARLHLLKDEKADALKYANEVIAATEIFQLVEETDITHDGNLMFDRELIWALYDSKTKEKLGDRFTAGYYAIDVDFKNDLYTSPETYGTATDYRMSRWWKSTPTTPVIYYLNKYGRIFSEMNKDVDVTPWAPAVPMIRLSEMYYIAAEAQLGINNPEAIRLLNTVRASRGIESEIPEGLSEKNILDQIVYEFRKDSWGEGKLFYLYKRLFRNIDTREEIIPASRDIYELPIPDDELEFGGNE